MTKIKNIFSNLSVQLLLSIFLALLCGAIFTSHWVSFFYSISSVFIEVLMFFLPFIIFSFVFHSLIQSQKQSLLLIVFIFVGVFLSNIVSLFSAYSISQIFLPLFSMNDGLNLKQTLASPISCLFQLGLKNPISTEKVMLFALLSGISISFIREDSRIKLKIKNLSDLLNKYVNYFLLRIFIPLLPIYVFGFCLKLSYENALIHLILQYGQIFLLSLIIVFAYLSIMFFIAAKLNFSLMLEYIKLMLPAGLTGFSTMSSAASMPVTLKCTQAATKDKEFSSLVIPSTVNIHTLGDNIMLVIMAMTLLKVFGMSWPDLHTFLLFSFAFAIAKLSSVGVPGASVLVILPVLENHLGFSKEMISIATTLYILQDPFGTFANVIGNGSFALILKRIYSIFSPKTSS